MERAIVSIVVLSSAGCLRAGDFRCSTDSDCDRGGSIGVCESVRYCSFFDLTCDSGRRYGDQSGSYAGQCVVGPARDAMAGDSPGGDAPAMVTLVARSDSAGGGATGLAFPVTTSSDAKRFLLVSVQLGSLCSDTTVPSVVSVAYNTAAFARESMIVGTPCNAAASRSEIWGLVNPDPGQHDLSVVLSSNAASYYIDVLELAGVNQTNPVRDAVASSGAGTSSLVTTASAAGDLVVNIVGQSSGIVAPGAGQSAIVINPTLGSSTLAGTAASTAPGSVAVAMTWSFTAAGDWQSISASLQP